MGSPAVKIDAYKNGHVDQYPDNTEIVYSNTTPRKSRMDGVDQVVVFGLQYFLKKYLIKQWNKKFFNKSENKAVKKYARIINSVLGPGAAKEDNLRKLHRLGYLPLRIKALPEGMLSSIRVPTNTVVNTHKDFGWLTNYIETIMQTCTWQSCTSATIAFEYRKMLTKYAKMTSDMPDFVQWQGHDFSMRGMSSLESACMSGAGHLISFTGTDTIPAVEFLEKYYGADCEKELIGGSVAATEHSVMCAGGEDSEIDTIDRLITKVYPKGIVSVVSDTWDYWWVLTGILPQLKDKIMARDGKYVVRPDSGDPVKIITGYFVEDTKMTSDILLEKMGRPFSDLFDDDCDCLRTSDGEYITSTGDKITEAEAKGSIQILYEIFGGTTNSRGYIQLDPHIGLIYGDSITLERARQILSRLDRKGFASTNVVLGIGSYTYQYNTRDTFGFACKGTWVQINKVGKAIFKDPKTDSGTKKSNKGLLKVVLDENGRTKVIDDVSIKEEQEGLLEVVFENSVLKREYTLSEIRERLLQNV